MNGSNAKPDETRSDTPTTDIQTDATGGADKEWPDEAKILPDVYLGDDAT